MNSSHHNKNSDHNLGEDIGLLKSSFGRYKFHIIISAVLGFLSGLVEGVGINILIPLFAFITKQDSYGSDFISNTISKIFLFLGIEFRLKYLLVLIFFLFLSKFILAILFYYVKAWASADYEEKIRTELFSSTLGASWPYLLKQKMGHLQTLLTTNIDYGSQTIASISNTLMVCATLLIYLLVAFNISFKISLLALLLGIMAVVLSKPILEKTKKLAQETSVSLQKVSHYVNENIVGMKTVKSTLPNKEILSFSDVIFKELKSLKIKIYLFKNGTSIVLQFFGLIFICAVFAYSYKYTGLNLGALVAIIYLIYRIFTYFQQLQGNIHNIFEAVPFLKFISDYQKESVLNIEKDSGTDDFIFNHSIQIKNVGFSYEQSSRPVLENLSFKINKGETVGLVGASGQGKTTLVDTILRLLNPTAGTILIDGQDFKNISLKKWRGKVGYVSQDIFLLNDTIANNIRFYNKDLSQLDIEKAAKMADIYDFIIGCPNGFDATVGDRGVLLSAGQRQRLIIARVLARRPELLILDEATSALDSESELKIQKVIEKLKGNITVLTIAHRLSTLSNYDKIIVLDKGRIIEEGSPQSLLSNSNSYYFKLQHLNDKI